MASKIYYFTGTSKWAKLWKPDEKYSNYSVDLYMTPKSWEEFKASGLQLKIRESDGVKYVNFKRPTARLIKGELVNFEHPTILDNEGEPLAEGTLVGNGSTVTLKVLVYDTVKGKGHRLEAVRVDELVEYQDNKAVPEDGAPF